MHINVTTSFHENLKKIEKICQKPSLTKPKIDCSGPAERSHLQSTGPLPKMNNCDISKRVFRKMRMDS